MLICPFLLQEAHARILPSMTKIGIVGATGNVGSSLVRRLAEDGHDVIALSRKGGTDQARVRHVVADLAHPTQLRDAVRGTDAVFLMVAGAASELDPRAIVGAIEDASVSRVVLLSSIGARSRPTAVSHEPLRQLEAAVRRSGLAWTILEPGGFASNARAWIQSVRTEATAAAPFADVAVPIVDPDDIAAVAATALRDDRHAGSLYALTGPVAISPREQCAELGLSLGKKLRFVELTRAQAAAAWRGFMPPTVVETTLDALGTPNELESTVSPDVERVLGRKPRPFSAWAARNASMFGG
jgi:uncharacterized protein YbjT (DUF2867 family)